MITSLDKNTALVVIDLQNGIVSMPPAALAEPVVNNAGQLAAAFRKAGLPVVLVNVNPTDSPLNPLRKDSKPMGGGTIDAHWLQIVDELNAQENDIRITKKVWNAFTNPALHEQLQSKGVTGIVLAGISTSIGVEGTARNAAELGYNISFAVDAMADMREDAQKHSVETIFPRLGEVGTTAEIIAKL